MNNVEISQEIVESIIKDHFIHEVTLDQFEILRAYLNVDLEYYVELTKFDIDNNVDYNYKLYKVVFEFGEEWNRIELLSCWVHLDENSPEDKIGFVNLLYKIVEIISGKSF